MMNDENSSDVVHNFQMFHLKLFEQRFHGENCPCLGGNRPWEGWLTNTWTLWQSNTLPFEGQLKLNRRPTPFQGMPKISHLTRRNKEDSPFDFPRGGCIDLPGFLPRSV